MDGRQWRATSAVVLALAVFARSAPADDLNSGRRPTPQSAATASLPALETRAYAAWQSRDARFWDRFLADGFIGWGAHGRLDKAGAARAYAGADCTIKSFGLADEHVTRLAAGVALMTYRASVDGACGGRKVPALTQAASVFVLDGNRWREAFHAGSAVISPGAAVLPDAGAPKSSGSPGQDPRIGQMFTTEKALWTAWKDHDHQALEPLIADEASFINIFGEFLPTRAEALKNWSSSCEVTRISLTEPVGRMLSPTVGIVTFHSTADGSCYGQKIGGAIWSSSIYVKERGAWKWAFGINVRRARRAKEEGGRNWVVPTQEFSMRARVRRVKGAPGPNFPTARLC